MSDTISLEDPQVQSVGGAWVTARSKKSGRVFYFNTLTGESVWNLSHSDLEKAKKRDRENVYHNLQEPPTTENENPPNKQMNIVREVKNNIANANYGPAYCASLAPLHNNMYIPQQPTVPFPPNTAVPPPNMYMPPPLAPYAPLPYAPPNMQQPVYQPPHPIPNPLYPAPYPPNQPVVRSFDPANDRFELIVHKTSVPLSNRFKANAEGNCNIEQSSHKENVLSEGVNVPTDNGNINANKCDGSNQKFDLRQVLLKKGLGRSQSNSSSVQQIIDQDSTKNESRDSSNIVNVEKTQDLHVSQRSRINPWITEPETELSNEQSSEEHPTDVPVTENVNGDNDDDDDEKWLAENTTVLYDNKTVLDVSALKRLSGSADDDPWFIIPDTNVFFSNLPILNVLINSDETCRILVVQQVSNEVMLAAKRPNGAAMEYRARYACRFISDLLQSERAVLSKDLLYNTMGLSYPDLDDEILDCCMTLLGKNYHMILLSNDKVLLRKIRTARIETFTIKQLKNYLGYYQRRTNTNMENKPILITLKNDDIYQSQNKQIEFNNTNYHEGVISTEENDQECEAQFNDASYSNSSGTSSVSEQNDNNIEVTNNVINFEVPLDEILIKKTIEQSGLVNRQLNRSSKKVITYEKPSKSIITFDHTSDNISLKSRVDEELNKKTNEKSDIINIDLNRSSKNVITYEKPSKSITFDLPANNDEILRRSAWTSLKTTKTIVNDNSSSKNSASAISSKIIIKNKSKQFKKDVPINVVPSLTNNQANIEKKTAVQLQSPSIQRRKIRLKRNLPTEKTNETPNTGRETKTLKWRRKKLTDIIKNHNGTTEKILTSPIKNGPATLDEKSRFTLTKNTNLNIPHAETSTVATKDERSDSEDSCIKKPSDPKNQTIVDDSSISGSDIISNTRSSDLSEKDLPVRTTTRRIREETNENDLFKVTDPTMDENLRVGIEEWVSRFMQIMEEVLTQVLQNHKELLDGNMRAPWTVLEASECIKKCFKKCHLVSDAAHSLSKTISKFTYDKGKITHLTPTQYLQMLSYGVYLVNSLKKEVENSEDIQTSEVLLSSLLNDIKCRNSLPENNDELSKDEESNNELVDVPEAKSKSCETAPTSKHSPITDVKKTNEMQPVKFIRNINIDPDFMKSLKLKPAFNSDQKEHSVEKPSNLTENIVITSPKSDNEIEISVQPKIVMKFNKCPEFEKRLLNNEILGLEVSNDYTDEDKEMEYDHLDYEADEMPYEDEEEMEYEENTSNDRNYYKGVVVNGTDKTVMSGEVGGLVKKFLVLVKETFAHVKMFCDQISLEFNYVESMTDNRKRELQKIIEHKRTVVTDLLETLHSIIDRETTTPTKMYVKTVIDKNNLLNNTAKEQLSSYGDVIGRCESQANILLDALSCIGQVIKS